MPVFTKSLRRVDSSNVPEALRQMADHIRYIQEQLEYTLMNLDSRNINEIDTDITKVTDTSGASVLGSYISLTGNNSEKFAAGKNVQTGRFEFTVNGKNGVQQMYLDSNGNLILTSSASIQIDCGTW